MKKVLLIIMIFISFNVIHASELENDIASTISEFNEMYRNCDENINLIVDNSELLLDKINENICKDGIINLHVDVDKIKTIDENNYHVETIIYAHGKSKLSSWEVSGFKVIYDIKNVDGILKVSNTDLFNEIGTENIVKSVFIILGIILGTILVIATVIITIVLVKKKKK